jgi:hypothetical protein
MEKKGFDERKSGENGRVRWCTHAAQLLFQ